MISKLAGSCILITGGTGSFGNAALTRFLKTEVKEIEYSAETRKNRMICDMNIRIQG